MSRRSRRVVRRGQLAAGAVAAVGAVSQAHTQGSCDGQWLPGNGIPGVDYKAHAAIAWDPDGTGPLPSVLVVGGEFILAGAVLANNIGVWNGSSWSALGAGTDGP